LNKDGKTERVSQPKKKEKNQAFQRDHLVLRSFSENLQLERISGKLYEKQKDKILKIESQESLIIQGSSLFSPASVIFKHLFKTRRSKGLVKVDLSLKAKREMA